MVDVWETLMFTFAQGQVDDNGLVIDVEDGVAGGRHQLAFEIQLEVAVSGVQAANWCVRDKKAFAFDGHIQWRPGMGDRAFLEAGKITKILNVGDFPLRAVHKELLEQGFVGLECGGAGVGDVAGNDF